MDENEMPENVEYIIQDKSHRTFTVIDNQIVWYGNVNPLSYNLAESSVLRLINASLAGKLTKGVMVDPTLFDR